MKISFIDLFKKSVYSPEFYRELQSKPLSFSIKYFSKISIILALVVTVFISFQLIPRLNFFLKDISPSILGSIPDGFTVAIKDGQASSNLSEPYYFPLPTIFNQGAPKNGEVAPKHLLVVNTQAPFESTRFEDYSTLFLLTQNSLVRGEESKIEILKLNSFGDLTITKEMISSFVHKIPPLLKRLSPLIVVVIFLAFLSVFAVKLSYLIFVAILVFLITKAKKMNLSYKNTYQISLHAASLPLFISALSYIFLLSIPFLFAILTVFVAWFNLNPPRRLAVEAPPQ